MENQQTEINSTKEDIERYFDLHCSKTTCDSCTKKILKNGEQWCPAIQLEIAHINAVHGPGYISFDT